ncbi:N-acetylmuramoyl-L-alanine amidase [Desulfolutivibrio sp.]|uniref:N-acetylmuramoyl-L-alanine amidase n=1 Tax=Desulfolutivibrio sp. TaxID=2773296 RepID=UPI002F969A71
MPMSDIAKFQAGKGTPAAPCRANRRRFLIRLAGFAAVAALSPLSLALASADPMAAAQHLLDAGKIEEAVVSLRRITAADPRNERAFILLGRAWAQSGKPAQALAAFREALRINPADTHTRMLADILAQRPILEEPVTGAKHGEKGGRRSASRLEKTARAEREAFVAESGRPPRPTGPFRLVIDAGHGGPDAGGVGASGLREKNVTLDLALQTAREIQGAGTGMAIFLTRMSDIRLSTAARAACVDLYAADLFLSLHAPSVDDAAVSGVHLFTRQGGGGPDAVAQAVAAFENRLAGAVPGFPRAGHHGVEAGLVRDGMARRQDVDSARYAAILEKGMGGGPFSGKGGVAAAGLSLLDAVDAPAVFAAMGFVSNAKDAAVLADADRRNELAGSLARAILSASRAAGGNAPG